MVSQSHKRELFGSNEEVTFGLLSEQLIPYLCREKQNSSEAVFRNCQLSTYHFHLRQIYLIQLADELNTTLPVISLATFALLIHRYMYGSESVDVIVRGRRLTIPIRNCNLSTIIMSIQLDDNVNKSEFMSTSLNTDQSSNFVGPLLLILSIMTKNSCDTNLMFECQLAYSDSYLDDKAARDMCEAYQRIIKYLSNLETTFDLAYTELVSIPLVSSNKTIDGPFGLPTIITSNSSIIYTHFQSITNRYPGQICLRQSDVHSLTYGQCLILIGRLSSILQCQLGVTKGSIIGLWMSSSFEYIISILATLKLSAIFVPLDAEHPAERLEFIEKQSHIDVILTNNKSLSSMKINPVFSAPILQVNVTDRGDLTTDNSYVHSMSPSKSKSEFTHNGGYIIFTSGSSGKPKGVLIEESSLFNMALSQIQIFDIKTSDIVAQFASICFDASLSEIFMALLSGACLVLFRSPLERAGSTFINILNSLSVTVITLPPSLLSAIDTQQLPGIRILISAGEPCPTVLAYKWIDRHRRFFNAYGPSEATVCATQYEFELATLERLAKNETLPIGIPIHNVRVRVIDSQLNDVLAGMPGELLLGGMGVSHTGYIGDIDNRTTMAFVTWNEARWYRTGDLVKTMTPNHRMLMYLGRMDTQVKLFGCRIELNEVETAALACPGVTHCIVVLHQCEKCDDNRSVLAAYVDGNATEDSIREHIAQKLPSYMLPTYIIIHSSSNLPTTLSGKIDRQLLAVDNNVHYRQTTTTTSLTQTEQQLSVLWCQLLNKQHKNDTVVQFNHLTFAQCGGSSLTVALLHALLLKQFSINADIHAHMSLKQMANLLLQSNNKTKGVSYTTIAHDLNSNLDDLVDNYHPHELNSRSSILLTGATGFLGCFLLNELLLTTSMNIVVLVRASSLDEANNRLRSILLKYDLFSESIQQIFNDNEKNRVQICLCGNLANENKSFSCLDLNNLWNDINAVLHCAADTNFNMTYENLRQVNVQFTIYLLQKCLRHGISLYYVSSLSTFLFTQENNESSPLLVTELDQPQLMSIVGGYSQSKYVAETLVLKSLQRGLRGAIFRPGRITGSSISGIGTTEDLFILMLQGCHQLGAYPQLKFAFDLTPVDKVSKAIVSIITSQQLSRNSAPLIVHLINTHTIPFDEQFKLLRRFGCCTTELEELQYNEWHEQLKQRVSVEQQQQSDSYNPLLPLIPFLQSSFWQHVEQWPIFAQTNIKDAVIDMCPETLFKLYCCVWKRTHLFD